MGIFHFSKILIFLSKVELFAFWKETKLLFLMPKPVFVVFLFLSFCFVLLILSFLFHVVIPVAHCTHNAECHCDPHGPDNTPMCIDGQCSCHHAGGNISFAIHYVYIELESKLLYNFPLSHAVRLWKRSCIALLFQYFYMFILLFNCGKKRGFVCFLNMLIINAL